MNTADPTPVGTIRPLEAGLPATDAPADRPADTPRPHPGDDGLRPRRRRWPRRIAVGFTVTLVLLAGYYGVSLYQVWSTGRTDQARPVDAIVVLGAAQYDGRPSPQLAARLDHVVRLWPEGYAPVVVTTGGSQPGDRFTEADASADYLIERGVPADAIVREDASSTTYESLRAVSDLLDERGLNSVLIVTDPFHALRSRLIAQNAGLTAYVSPTTTSVVRGRSAWSHNLQEAGGIMVGRVIGFNHL